MRILLTYPLRAHEDFWGQGEEFSSHVNLSYSAMLYFKRNGHLSIYSFSSSPRRRFVLQTEISGKYILLFILYLNSVSYSTSCR